MISVPVSETECHRHPDDRLEDGYEDLRSSIFRSFDAQETEPLFTTTVPNLWPVFLENLPENARQHYTCNACRHFVEKFGGLVRIGTDGRKYPALWSADVPAFFKGAVSAIVGKISKSKVNGVFISSLKVYGTPKTGEWLHMTATPRTSLVWKSQTQTDSQRAAELIEDQKTLLSVLDEYPKSAVAKAVKLLMSDSLYRSDKVLGVAEWLYALHEALDATKNAEIKNNLIWRAVATAPAGFCHAKNSMIGTLLEDIAAGMDFSDASRRFAAKMNPLQYQRPQAAPTAGAIAQAEKIFAQLDASKALHRRFARFDEVPTIWKPAEKQSTQATGGVFAHLAPKSEAQAAKEITAPPVVMTWEKFARMVLPEALSMDLYAGERADYAAITTAVYPDAPPILQWDREESRNPLAWYYKRGSSHPSSWNLRPGWVKVNAICPPPSAHIKAVHFILDGCRDMHSHNGGNAIFPESLKSEFHGIRSVIEAYSGKANLEGAEEASACGVRCTGGNKEWNVTLRVVGKLGVTVYKIDRMD